MPTHRIVLAAVFALGALQGAVPSRLAVAAHRGTGGASVVRRGGFSMAISTVIGRLVGMVARGLSSPEQAGSDRRAGVHTRGEDS
jgi:hypothetical protein